MECGCQCQGVLDDRCRRRGMCGADTRIGDATMSQKLPCDRCGQRFGDHQLNVHKGTLLCDDCLDGQYAPPHEPPDRNSMARESR